MAFQADYVVVWKVDVAGSHGIGKRAVEKIVIAISILPTMKAPRGNCVHAVVRQREVKNNLRCGHGVLMWPGVE